MTLSVDKMSSLRPAAEPDFVGGSDSITTKCSERTRTTLIACVSGAAVARLRVQTHLFGGGRSQGRIQADGVVYEFLFCIPRGSETVWGKF